ncbi:alpha-galactosidase [Acidobacterium sp. S8]|uniref:alpha-galactosidase n=1 Tax=Acidobacterium sp. S8 TaxID=1641854 RepID=UPI00131E0505|nr:alpha-galactosidase [Acidobacterium sp. S8]
MKCMPLVAVFLLSAWNAAQGAETQNSWSLTTGDTTVVVAIQDDTPTIVKVGSKKDAQNWLLTPVPETLPSSITQQGNTKEAKWQYVGGDFDAKSGQLVLRFSDQALAMDLQSIWQARPGHGPVEHWLTITNHSQATITIGHQDSLVLRHLIIPDKESMDAWWIKRGGGNATDEGGTFTRSVGKNSDETLVSDPTDGASPVPWLALQIGTSRGLYVGWEFSGIGRIRFHSDARQGSTDKTPGELGVDVGNLSSFKTDIEAGETFLVPPAFVGCYTGDIDDGSYTLHRFVLEKLVPKFPDGYAHPTLAYNLYLDGGGANADEKIVLRSAALAKELGFETFVVDAMWFPQSGDWRWDPKRFPHGSKPIEEYVHTHDMKLGLWMAYTHGSNSDDPSAISISRHPDWFASPPKLDPEGHINWNALIDLGYDPARDWVEKSTQRVTAEYKLDYFKTDYTPIVTNCQQTNHRHHYGVDVSYWSTLGYYAVQEALMQKFPDLILEGCSGSGHIKDFGDIRRVHMIAINDTLSSLPNRQAIYDSTFAFPPAVLMDYTYENFYDIVSDAPEPYLWRSSMMNQWQIDPTNSAGWTSEQRAKVKRSTDIYKSWIRPILQDVEVHHIMPRPDGYHWDGLFYWSPSLKRGTLYIFKPNSDTTAQRISLKGLSPTSKYKVTTEDHSTADATYSGAELMSNGIQIRLPDKYTSDLVYFEEVH